jgi:5-methylthioadenosine/S-adenosylhomocysteine deaminase
MNLEHADLILKNATIVTQNDRREILSEAAIAIHAGRIAGLGPSGAILEQYESSQVLDLSDQIIFPGLINNHNHLFQVSTKGLGEDMPVQEWVKVVTAPTAIHIRPEEMYAFCLSGCVEAIHCGVTTLVDMSYRAQRFEMHEQNIQAMLDSGLRGRYTTIISDFGEEYGVLPELIAPIDWFMEQYRRLHAQYQPTDRMAVWLAIGAPWTVTDRGIQYTVAYAGETGTPLTMHINENGVDNMISQQRHGMNIVPYLEQVGFLRPDLLAIHNVVCDQTDIDLYAKYDVKISYNPVSNMYLGSGIPPIMAMAKAGLSIGIGTDGAGSNNSLDMLESIKMAALLQKVAAQDAAVVGAQQVLDWATRDAARSIWLENEIGSLEVGKRADLFALRLNTSKIVPMHDPVTSLVYSAGEQNVVLTVADGKILMQDGVLVHLDEADILRRCQVAATQLADRCGSNAKVTRRWRPRRLA